ncbi:hypothetical protein [Deinococcus sp. Leaf326]|uniref:hypothetical protein n=1 Tax=Deinococcus sp. Leaf326 TaxID=1736338 RepID=UPI000ADFF4DD|nr:hypothetical protein [Deinococcus sp. Leaf326]
MTYGSLTAAPAALHEFALPLGYADAAGRLHRRGLMRLATAFDEIEPLGDPRVQGNEAYLGLLLLSRVVVRLGDFSPVPPEVIAGLYTADFAYLQGLYLELNTALSLPPGPGAVAPAPVAGPPPAQPVPLGGTVETTCPHCGSDLLLDLSGA